MKRRLQAVTGLGWTVLGLGVVAWIGGWRLGWEELMVAAAACAAALLVAAVLTFGGMQLHVDVSVDPGRIVIGEHAVGRIGVTNTTGRRMLPLRLEAPVGDGTATIAVPSLSAGELFEEVFVIPGQRRSVVRVGPIRAVRGDPLGLLRRETSLADSAMLYVHPRTVAVPGITAGLRRDLEGRTTNDRSTSDVAFHTLREYVPGDDRRHIHWRTSARLDKLMVRQFVDTRRAHLALVLPTTSGTYATDDEAELAIAAAASIGLSILRSEQELTCATNRGPLPAYSPTRLLDEMAGVVVNPAPAPLRATVQAALPLIAGASVIVLFGGSPTPVPELRAAAGSFQTDARIIAVRCQPDVTASYQLAGTVSLLHVGLVDDLARLLRAVADR